MADNLREEFRRRAEEALAGHPDLRPEWTADLSRLWFPRVDDLGFDVEVCVGDREIVVQALGAHEHFELGNGTPSEVCASVLGLVRDLLSPDVRIREIRSRGRPFRWFVESRNGPEWQVEAETGLLFFNYFGRRTERVCQNRQLPGRTHRAG